MEDREQALVPSSPLDKGVFMLSMDAELAWGSIYNDDYERYEAQYDGCRVAIDALLQLLETYEISATWAMVGHLFLDSCTTADGVKHPVTLPSA